MDIQKGDSLIDNYAILQPYLDKLTYDIKNRAISSTDAIKALNSMNFEVTKDFEKQLLLVYSGAADIESVHWDESLIKFVGIDSDEDAFNKAKEKLDEIGERYWSINKCLDTSEQILNRISKALDRAFGGGKLKALRAYLILLETNIELLEKKLTETKDYLAEDLSDIMSLNFNFEFDKYGNILNYREAEDAFGKDSSEIKDINQYQTTLKQVADLEDQIIDNRYSLKDSQLEEINLTITYDTKAADFELEYIERMLDRLKNKAFAAAEAMALIGRQMPEEISKLKSYEQGIENILNKNNLAGLSAEQLKAQIEAGKITIDETDIDKLQEYYNNIETARDKVLELHDSMHEQLSSAIDKFNEKISEQSDKLEHYTFVLDNYKNIIDLIGKANLGIDNTFLKQISDALVDLSQKRLQINKDRLEILNENLKEAEAAKKKAEDEGLSQETITKWEQTIATILAEVNEAESDFLDSWNSSLEAAADAFKSNVELIAETFDKAVSGAYAKVELMREAFDRQLTVSKRFLENYEKTYEINKLNRNIDKQIDNTKNVKAQRQLADLAAEINAYSAEDRKMSKIDLEYMQKKYDLMVAQIALEEAQNAKNQVRLTRDSEGNWGYVYTTNQSDTEKAQLTLDDKKYAMEQFMHNTETDLTSQMIDLQADYKEKLVDLAEKYGTDSEIFEKESEKLIQEYTEDLDYLIDQYTALTARGAADAKEWGLQVAENFRQTLLGSLYPDYADFGELQNGINIAVIESIGAVEKAYLDYGTTVSGIMETVGTSVENFGTKAKTTYDEIINKVPKATQKVKELVAQHSDEKTGFPAAIKQILSWENAWNETLIEIENNDKWEKIKEKITTLLSNWKNLQVEMNKDTNFVLPPKENFLGSGSDTGKNWVVIDTKSGDGLSDKQSMFKVVNQNTGEEGWVSYNEIEEQNSDSVKKTTGISYNRTYSLSSSLLKTEEEAKNILDYQLSINNQDLAAKEVTEQRKGDFILGYKDNDGNLIWRVKDKDNNKIYDVYAGNDGVYRDKQFREVTYDGNDIVDDSLPDIFTLYDEGLINYLRAGKSIKNDENANIPSINDSGKEGANIYFNRSGDGNETFRIRPYKISNNETPLAYIERVDGEQWAGKDKWNTWVLVNETVKAKDLRDLLISSFDTGGYTGDWGNEGKLAVLHQKEIILNATDTENFLTAIEIVRSLSDKLERNALLANQGLGNIIASSNLSLGGDTLEQHVTITAEFPNVVDHNEIQEAFNNIVNQASLYANRNR